MKRNRKKYILNELSKSMESIGPQEQHGTVGGYEVFDTNGNYLGSVGSCNEIRVVREGTNINHMSLFDLQASTVLSSCSSDVKQNIIDRIAESRGIGQVNYGYDSDNRRCGWCDKGAIWFNLNSDFVATGNYYDIVLILEHENDHAQRYYADPQGWYSATAFDREFPVLQNTYHNPNFSLAPADFQGMIHGNMVELWKQMGIY